MLKTPSNTARSSTVFKRGGLALAVVCVAVLLWMTPYLWGTQSTATSVSLVTDSLPVTTSMQTTETRSEPVAKDVGEELKEGQQVESNQDPEAESPREEYSIEPFLGTWQANPDGRLRTVTNREDGTSTIHVKMDYLGSFFYGAELTMECKWWINDGYLYHECQSGTPQANVTKLTNDLGAMTKFEILETSEKALKLKDIFHYTDQVFVWKRVEK